MSITEAPPKALDINETSAVEQLNSVIEAVGKFNSMKMDSCASPFSGTTTLLAVTIPEMVTNSIMFESISPDVKRV